MKPVLLMSFMLTLCAFAPNAPAQQGTSSPNASSASGQVRNLEKRIKAQTMRIRKLEQDLQTRDEEIHMLVKVVSRQSEMDSPDPSNEGNSGSGDCDVNSATRILRVRTTQSPRPVQP